MNEQLASKVKDVIRGDYKSIMDAMSEEEQEKAAAKTRKLIHKDRFLQLTLTVLRESRRLYYMGLAAINRHMDEIGAKPEDGREAILVTAATQEGLKEFDREDVKETLQSILAPFVASECALAAGREADVDKAERGARDAVRRASPVAVPGPSATEHMYLPRGKVTVLLGSADAFAIYKSNLMSFLDEREAADDDVSVMHLIPALKPNTINKRKNANYLPVGASTWSFCAQNISTMHDKLDPFLPQMLNEAIDILLVEDLAHTYKGIFSGVVAARLAGHAQKTFCKYAEEQGAAVLAHLQSHVPDELEATGDWEELLKFADVYRVTYSDADDLLTLQPWDRHSEPVVINSYLKD